MERTLLRYKQHTLLSPPLTVFFQPSFFSPASSPWLLPCTFSCACSSLSKHIPGDYVMYKRFSKMPVWKCTALPLPVHNRGSNGSLHNVGFQSLSNLSERNLSLLKHPLCHFFVFSLFFQSLGSLALQTLSPVLSCSFSQ